SAPPFFSRGPSPVPPSQEPRPRAEPAQIALVEDDAAVLDSLQLYLARQDSGLHALGRPKIFSMRSMAACSSTAVYRMSACRACQGSTSSATSLRAVSSCRSY